MAVLKKVAVPLLLAAASALLLAGPADAAFRSLKNDGNNNQQDNWVDKNDNNDGWDNNDNNKMQLSPPTVICGEADTVAPDSITVVVCPAVGEEAKHGFKLEWLSEEAFVANNGFGCNSTDAADGICAAKISGDNVDEDGCATFVIGESDLEDVRFKPPSCGDLTLECSQTYVFRAFALGGRNRRTSEPSVPEFCSTEECYLCPDGESCQEDCEAPLVDIGCVEPCPVGATRNDAGSCVCPPPRVYNSDENICECPGDLQYDAAKNECKCPPTQQPLEDCPEVCVPIPDELVKCVNTNTGQGSLCGACVTSCNQNAARDAICELYLGPDADECKISGAAGAGNNETCAPLGLLCCVVEPVPIRPGEGTDPDSCPLF